MRNSLADVTERRVLVVDDNANIHEDFRRILSRDTDTDVELDALSDSLFGDRDRAAKRNGFEVDTASQGREGLECVLRAKREGRPYAIAFVDMRMPPGWNGVETAAELWKEDPSIQLVICTAYSDFSWGDVVRTLGDATNLHLLRKPFQPNQIRKLARVLTTKWERLRRRSA